MTAPSTPKLLPDVANDAVALARPLDWVGMDRIALPVRIGQPSESEGEGCPRPPQGPLRES